jgi:hypothetical protein
MPRRASSGRLRRIHLSRRAAGGQSATLTTLYLIHEKDAEAAVRIPDSHHSYAIIPVGYPVAAAGGSIAAWTW